MSLIAGGTVFAAAFVSLGCPRGDVASSGQTFAKIDDFQPYVEPYSKAYILLGSSVETDVVTEKGDGTVSFKFFTPTQSHDESPIDEERYAYDASAFRYLGSTEKFEPGIPLLKFPFTVGESWDWTGIYNLGAGDRKASAKITTSADRLNTHVGEFSTVRVVVDLTIETGSKDSHKFKLTFWFVPKGGIVRREFELSSTREPMPAKSP